MTSSKLFTLRKFIFAGIVSMLVFAMCEANSQKLCGSKLSDAIKFVCKNNYNTFRGKKSISITDYYDDEVFNFNDNERTPFINKLYGGMLSPNIRRIKEGIVNECCRKPCKLEELSAYCSFAK